MDLKDVIKSNREKAIEAHNAFHAGHSDVAENYLMEQMLKTCAYFDGKITLPGGVNEPTDKLKPAEVQSEKPAAVPGDAVRPAAVLPADEGSKVLPASQFQKPNQ